MPYINSAQTIFFNGALGFLEKPETQQGMQQLLNALAHAPGTTIIAGGDSVAAANKYNVSHKIDHLLTGGGSTLQYIANQKLPGLEILK